MSESTETFAHWLEEEFEAKEVNLPSINIVANIYISRYRYIRICSDIAKHNLARLSTNVDHIRKLLDACGHPITEQEGYLAVEDFFSWFHGHVFNYHLNQVAELLNNIRWAMFSYLQHEFARSWQAVARPEGAYRYQYPQECTEPVAKAMYWELMNRVRAEPYVPRFVVPELYKLRY